jgi:replicative DNA helicase
MTAANKSADGSYVPNAAPGQGGSGPQAIPARTMPHSPEAEVCALGAMILDASTIDIIIQFLQADDFYLPSHRVLYDVICRMHNESKPIDLVTLKDELTRAGLLDKLGGKDYLVALVDGVPSIASAEYYAKMVRDKALLRNLISANQLIAQDAFDSPDEPRAVLDRAESKIFEIASRQVGEQARSLESLLQHTFETLQNADGSSITGVATGYYKMDELTSGFQKSEMIVLAARPSMGKTALALNMAEFMAADDGKCVLIFSLEMSKEQLALRFLASRARFDSGKLRRGNISPEDWTQLQLAADSLSKASIFIDDSADVNIFQLRAKARRLAASLETSGRKLACIFVDYLQLMGAAGRVESRQQQISDISRGIKALARELAIPVVVLSQLNRGPEDREGHRPRMSDLRESGAIEQDADVVILLHREDYYHKGEAGYDQTNITEAILAKQRNGPTGAVPLTFIPDCVRFENCNTEGVYGQ